MTYKQFREMLDNFSEEQLNMEVVIFDTQVGEFADLNHIEFNEDYCDLERDHPYFLY